MTRPVRVRELLRSDLARYTDEQAGLWVFAKTAFGNPGLIASGLLRAQQRAVAGKHTRVAKGLRQVSLVITGADFVPGCDVGPGLRLSHPHGVVIGGGAVLGANCTVQQNVTLGERYADGRGPHAYPAVGEGVTLGAGACVLGGISVGAGATVGANAVVLEDVPASSVAVGNPARVIHS